MKLSSQIVFFICFLAAIYFYKTLTIEAPEKDRESYTSYTLRLVRGASHCEEFVVTMDSVLYFPGSRPRFREQKYDRPSKTSIDSVLGYAFFKEIEERGFWELKSASKTSFSCTEGLTITLEGKGRSKTIFCGNFDRNTPDVVRFIDQKVVELGRANTKRKHALEGNYLTKLSNPG